MCIIWQEEHSYIVQRAETLLDNVMVTVEIHTSTINRSVVFSHSQRIELKKETFHVTTATPITDQFIVNNHNFGIANQNENP